MCSREQPGAAAALRSDEDDDTDQSRYVFDQMAAMMSNDIL